MTFAEVTGLVSIVAGIAAGGKAGGDHGSTAAISGGVLGLVIGFGVACAVMKAAQSRFLGYSAEKSSRRCMLDLFGLAGVALVAPFTSAGASIFAVSFLLALF